MSRSVKDLRELINISRLSFHGEEEHFNSDERKEFLQNGGDLLLCEDETPTNTCLTSEKDCKEPRTSLRNGRFKPLPAIGSSNTSKKCDKSENIKTKQVKDVEMLYQKSCRCILKHIDGSVVTSWLHRSNESAEWLAKWVSAKDFFARFAKFWLSEMDRQKQKELIEMEVEIILDELEFSVHDGIKSKKVSQHDVMLFFLLIIWEYPSKMCGLQSDIFVLNVLVTLSSGQKDRYRKLLSNVKFATKDAEEIHWILSVRAFALISIITALVKFYSSVMGQLLPNNVATDVSVYHLKSLEDFAFDAARLGYLDVLVYLVEEQNLEILGLMNDDDSSLLFCAITCSQAEIMKYILEVCIIFHINPSSCNDLSPPSVKYFRSIEMLISSKYPNQAMVCYMQL